MSSLDYVIASSLGDHNIELSPQDAQRGQSFYLRAVVFKAGNTLFQLPRSSLPKESKFFDDVFAGTESTSDATPVILEDSVTADDLRSLLKLTFRAPELSGQTLTLDDCMSVLKLAKIWSDTPLREQAVTGLDTVIQHK